MKIIVSLGIILVVILFVVSLYFLAPTGFSDEKIRIVRPLDFPADTIFSQLEDQNLIRSKTLLSLLLFVLKPGGTIEPGAYQLSHRMNLFQIADTLLNHPYQKWVTLIPGLRKEQVAEKLAEKFSWKDSQTKEFLEIAKEGYLFPDTYLLNVDYSPEEMYQRILSNFNEKFDAQMQKDLLSQNIRNDTAIKIASLIEREAGGEDDKALIAGIIWNRLNKNMKLQIDATIQYAMGKGHGFPADSWWPEVSHDDILTNESPYNTYKYEGLPPGPIASPSLSSIKSVVYPQETDCLYYLHDANKQIHCAETYEEHLENIKNYL
ncbi:endolytic transglycosylase MltG [Candidatus Gottesmanbacteria bacterium]|nr:endolytic transglycosylase MltG [Candidatus Gottesmanbacteria bacterium]